MTAAVPDPSGSPGRSPIARRPDIRLAPEPTPAEADAVRQALAALGLIEPAAAEPSGDGEPAP